MKIYVSFLFLLILLLNLGCYRISKDELRDVESAIDSSEYSLALKKLSVLEKKYTGDPIIYYLKGYSFLKIGNTQEALKAFRKTFEIRKNYSVMIGDIDVANFFAGNSTSSDSAMFRGALREIDTIIDRDGNDDGDIEDRVRYHKAMLLVIKKEYRKAISELEIVVNNNIDSEYDAKGLFEKGIIIAEYLQNENEGLGIIDDLLDKYPDKRETAPKAMLWISEYKIKRAKMFNNRVRSLEDFIKSWKGMKGFQEDIKEAIVQIGSDSKQEKVYLSEAIETINKIIEIYPESSSAKQAEVILKNLNRVSEQNT